MKVYRVPAGEGLGTAEARALEEALRRLDVRLKGRVTPYDLIEVSRDPRSPTHKLFEWNDAKAAHEYRVQQARGYIELAVSHSTGVAEARRVPVNPLQNTSVSPPRVRVAEVSEAEMRDRLLRRAIDDARGWVEKHGALRNVPILQPIFESVQTLIAELDGSENESRGTGRR